jgi:DNA repair exonuclease SbcCD ATPase subunit
MITLQTLKWSNAFSYGADNTLNLTDSTVTQIIGTNGMGKSSIPLIIEEVCFNKNSKGIKKADIPNRYIKDGYEIYLSFTKGDVLYEITVKRKASIKVKFEQDGKDISSHTATNTYKSIQEVIGVDFKTFSQLVYQSTNASLQFLTATDTNRKKFLIDLLHLEHYVLLFDIFKEASRQSTLRLAEITSAITTVERWLLDNKLEDTTILPMIKIEIDTKEEELELVEVMTEIKNISEKNKKIQNNNQYRSQLNSIDLSTITSIKATELISYDDLQAESGELKQVIAGSQRTLTKMQGIGQNCPTCEQTVPEDWKNSYIERLNSNISQAEEKLNEEIAGHIKSIKQNNADYKRKNSLQEDWETLYRSINSDLPTNLVDRQELDSRLDRVRGQLLVRKAQISRDAEENKQRTQKNTRIEVIQEQSEGFTVKLKQAQQKLHIENNLASNLEVLKKSFSTNGLIAYKIENLVKELEELANTYLAELSDGRFTLEFIVSNDKLNVQITDNAIIVDITALSSGELARVNTATLIAIRKLMSSISKSRINILFLDEVMSVLDDAGREKLVEVLLGEEELNTFVVTHEWSHPLLNKVVVVKQGNVSSLEV